MGDHAVRFGWGAEGAAALAGGAAALVVVDVLSFTTAVSVAADAGTRVFPCPWRDGTAAAFAERHGARLAVGRREAGPDAPWSLSPAALRRAPAADRLVLPSPNGSAISAAAARDPRTTVVAACLRNASAVARWLTERRFGTAERPLGVIAAGELRPDGSLRPAVEDLLGAGAVLAALGRADLPPAAAFTSAPDVPAAIRASASARELIASGFPEDVTVATEQDTSPWTPVLHTGAFTPR